MLSYRHEYHAGNHADLLKHYCLFESLRYFASKKKLLAILIPTLVQVFTHLIHKKLLKMLNI